ncbi:MAG: hypothetical protein OEL69_02185 [Nitrosopumilus sp.]|nr:hypothetical protein [Nitrosopumilus sp.]
MKIKCPCCSHKFTITEDNIFFDYSDDVDYNSEKYVWEELPLLKLHFKPQQLNSLESK